MKKTALFLSLILAGSVSNHSAWAFQEGDADNAPTAKPVLSQDPANPTVEEVIGAYVTDTKEYNKLMKAYEKNNPPGGGAGGGDAPPADAPADDAPDDAEADASTAAEKESLKNVLKKMLEKYRAKQQ